MPNEGDAWVNPAVTSSEDLAVRSDPLAKVKRENFPVAALLPGRYRRHLLAVYAFARLVDDIGDEPPHRATPLLDHVDAELDVIETGGAPRSAVLRGVAVTVDECGVPVGTLRRLVRANRREQLVRDYATQAQLLEYCELSANPVGHAVLHVFGAMTPQRRELSDRVCTALQLVEHCQDVGEDAARGRCYLPAEDRERLGCRLEDLRAARAGDALRWVVGLQAGRARALLDAGAPLVGQLSGWARLAVAGYLAGGRAALDALDASGYDVLAAPVRAGRGRVALAWLRTLLRGR